MLQGKHHKSLIITIVVLVLAIISTQQVRPVQAQTTGFVSADRTAGMFLDNGRPFRFIGANVRELPWLSSANQEKQLDSLYRMGVKVIRVFAARNDKSAAETVTALRNLLTNIQTRNSSPPADFPPGSNIKLLISLTDNFATDSKDISTNPSIYFRRIVQHDDPAYDMNSAFRPLNPSWFASFGVFPNYTTYYAGFAQNVVTALKSESNIFGWELGNELRAPYKELMLPFVQDMGCKIQSWDPNHMVSTGFVSTYNANGYTPSNADQFSTADIGAIYNSQCNIPGYTGPAFDFGSVHAYDNGWSPVPCGDPSSGDPAPPCPENYNHQDQEMAWFKENKFPYIVGELSFTGAFVDHTTTSPGNNNGQCPTTPVFPGGMFDGSQIPPILADRATALNLTLDRFLNFYAADGVFQWAYMAEPYDFGTGDACRGMSDSGGNQSAGQRGWGFADFDSLTNLYKCRSARLAGNTVGQTCHTPAPQLSLSYVSTGAYNVGTSCTNPSQSPSLKDWRLRVVGVPPSYTPVRLVDGVDGFWVAPPCDASSHWPLVATRDGTSEPGGTYGWNLDVFPWNAVNDAPSPNKTYTLTLSNTNGVSITVTLTPPQIAYRTSSGIFVISPDGISPRQLTTNATDNYPVWSPDHSRIAFVSSRDGNEEIYVINVDGTGLRRLTNSATYDLAPSWSPDGAKILFFSRRAGNAEIYTMNAADGTGLLRLTTNAAEDTYPTWSPNGLRIAFDSTRPGNEEIYVMNANGSGVLRRSTMAGYDHFPYWAPNNQTILFTGYHTGNDVFTVNASTGSPTKITTVTADDYYASWSPDGTRILFMSVRDGNAEIYVMNANGSAQTRLTNTTAGESYANWSPDGTMITFVRGGGIYVMNANGTGERRLPSVGNATDLNWWRPMQIR